MRRKAILLAILPLADALSLANFQQITSALIPITCQLVYDSQIPSCQVSDFNNGCSSVCQSALNLIANDVSIACSDVSVSSNTLLGIVMNGDIIQALCPATSTTTSTVAKSTSANVESASSAAASVTIPTTSPGVLVTTTPSTTSKAAKSTQSASTTHSTSAKTTDTTESSESASAAASSSTTAAQTTEEQNTTSTSTKKNVATSTKTTAAATTSKAGQEGETQDSGSGGGSPFDISSSGNRLNGGSMFAFVVAAWGCVLLGR